MDRTARIEAQVTEIRPSEDWSRIAHKLFVPVLFTQYARLPGGEIRPTLVTFARGSPSSLKRF